jgi:hypothetical protein
VAIYSHHWLRVAARTGTPRISPPPLFRLQIQAFAELQLGVAIAWHSACEEAVVDLQPIARSSR